VTFRASQSFLQITIIIMAASAAAKSLLDVSTAAIASTDQSLQTGDAVPEITHAASRSALGLLGRIILSTLGVLPSILFWISYTLPTWLFTLFSTTLTFTMNFSSL
jgi:lysophospholipid hydrolase